MKTRKRYLAAGILFALVLLYWMRPRYNPEPAGALSREEYIETFAPLAVEVSERYGLIPSVVLAQSALESNFGESELSRNYNNYFGIKGKGDAAIVLPTEEIEGGKSRRVSDGFRTYDSARESFFDYGKLIADADRYRPVREAETKEAYAEALYPAGYSTNPRYGERLLFLIETYHLDRYDPQ